MSEPAIANLYSEQRTFPPPESFAAQANANDPSIYEEAEADPEGWWAQHARQLRWMRDFDTVLEWTPPHAKWFIGGELNVADNCLDRHVDAGYGEQIAFYWEGEPGDTRALSYAELKDEVSRFANALRGLGVGKGDRVAIYLPMIPELPVAMLACARIGAIHSVVFAGFSSQALVDRVDDADARVVITADGAYRKGNVVPLKESTDKAIAATDRIETSIVVRRTGAEVDMQAGRDHWYHELVSGQSTECPAEPMDAEDVLYILYTSGTTGKPKGIVHTTGGYLTHVAATQRLVFDLKADSDVYWCAADIGWVTGHSYIVYGPLACRATSVLYEGAPDYPGKDRWWEIANRYGVTILYTAPTAIRAFMKWGAEYPQEHDLSSIRLLGSVGEPINPEAWMWYHQHIGGGNAPVVDTWWQTETGGIMITPLPGITHAKPGSAMVPFPGVKPVVVDDAGEPVPRGSGGYLTLQRPWPGMMRTLWGDDERYRHTYWSSFGPDVYFAGDGAKLDEDGHIWLLGRVDDVMNVSGHRISTTEVESALVDHPKVAEAAVTGRKDELTGEAIVAFVTLRGAEEGNDELAAELREHVAERIGKLARPANVLFTPDLPKTRSGKIMRRLLKDIAEGRELGDVSTLANADIVEELSKSSAGGDE
ncbi:acetate--CoA ligase [Egibacter rhizosphaerae]|uniref:Acetyl-coenzyme A synthetase n=1 Tax=Egibacter rhizosphaerae TaxID=1670831 RepID=A0A411YHN9_9ACTN|nr:acetate--CoA ligase [Egibacter rhizosphaerae]QBI20629.1 acetate--CoA ligase [Egibacter rhizosphaerae]